MSTIIESTIRSNLCIGCGICCSVCPTKAIKMEMCSEKYEKPKVDFEKCINCSSCVKYCPHAFDKVIEEAKKVCECEDYNEFGIQNSKYYVAYNKNNEERKESCSGGIATYIAEYLMTRKLIDCVVHAKMVEGKTNEQHYKSSISVNIDEIKSKRRSFYSAISFSESLLEIQKNNYKRVLFIGTPCVIRGFNNLIKNNSKYKNIEKMYTIALACSHNANGMFTDYLADSLEIDKNIDYKVDLRNKDSIKDANSFKNHYFNNSGTICKVNRFESEFTKQWRNYSFSMNVCSACSDFWGYTADISVKDAWGKWAKDPLGESIVIVRNNELNEIFNNNDELYVEEIDKETIIKCQKPTVKYKQYYAKKRANIKSPKKLNKISILHRRNSFVRKYSIRQYKIMQVKGYNRKLKLLTTILSYSDRIVGKLRSIIDKIKI